VIHNLKLRTLNSLPNFHAFDDENEEKESLSNLFNYGRNQVLRRLFALMKFCLVSHYPNVIYSYWKYRISHIPMSFENL